MSRGAPNRGRRPAEALGEQRVALLRPPRRRVRIVAVARRVFEQRGAFGFEVRRIAVGAERDARARAQRRRIADAVAAVGARILHQPAAELLGAPHLRLAEVHAVREDRAGRQRAEAIEPLQRSVPAAAHASSTSARSSATCTCTTVSSARHSAAASRTVSSDTVNDACSPTTPRTSGRAFVSMKRRHSARPRRASSRPPLRSVAP